jgi:stage III sporulation protein AG
MEDKTKEKLKKVMDSGKLRNIIIVTGIVGIALIFLSSFSDIGLSSEKSDEGFSVTTYSTEIRTDLESVISKIEGAGQTKVLLTMENSVEYVYLDDTTTKTKEIQPLIRGVLVVCEGGDDPVVVERVTNAVTKALDISTAKVCIAKLSE